MNINDIKKIIESPELEDIYKLNKYMTDKNIELDSLNFNVLSNFNLSLQYLLKDNNIYTDILLYENKNTTQKFKFAANTLSSNFIKKYGFDLNAMNDIIVLTIKKATIGLKTSDSMSYYDALKLFPQFTDISGDESIPEKFSSLLKTILQDDLYEELYSILNNDGIELLNSIATNYNSYTLPTRNQIKQFIPMKKISDEEKEMFEFYSNDIALYIKYNLNQRTGIYFCNFNPPKDTAYPKFDKSEIHNENNKNFLMYEKLFIYNHYDEIKNGMNKYIKYQIPKIQSHINFLTDTNKLLNKYVVASKL